MKANIIESLYCPYCHKKLECEIAKIDCGEIKEGTLTCQNMRYRHLTLPLTRSSTSVQYLNASS